MPQGVALSQVALTLVAVALGAVFATVVFAAGLAAFTLPALLLAGAAFAGLIVFRGVWHISVSSVFFRCREQLQLTCPERFSSPPLTRCSVAIETAAWLTQMAARADQTAC